jgi:AcrR family transcriptional regulator
MDSGIDCRGKSEKINSIIEVAQKRFGQYGLEKTSMREIANDLNMSKGSIYYYFPDKENLYKAVVEKEQCEFLGKLMEKVNEINDPVELIREYVVTRLSYFRTLLNLSMLRSEAYSGLRPVLNDTILEFKEKEKKIIKQILDAGISKGIFIKVNTGKTASLFMDLLRGLRLTVINNKKMFYIEQEEFKMLLEKTIAFTDIFINGLTIKNL